MNGKKRSGQAARAALAAVGLLFGLTAGTSRADVTATFGGTGEFTHPGTLKIEGRTVKVDLSVVGKARVHRAVFVPKRELLGGHDARALKKVAVTSAGQAVPLLGPRYRSFNATAAVRAALAAGTKAAFRIDSLPGWDGRTARLEVRFDGKAKAKLPVVTDLAARHRGGQTILTFREADPPITAEKATLGEVRAARKKLAAAARKLTYRIYRATQPGRWRLVDEIGPLTCWADEYHGATHKPELPVRRYAVADGAAPVPPGVGIYAHNPAKAGKAWYAVTAAVDGREDLDRLSEGSTVGPIAETVGPGEPVLQRIEKPESFNYRKAPTLRYYVRWEAPPRCNVPSRPIDYVLAIPQGVKWPAPLNVAFHCWGGSLNGGYGWWYRCPPRTSLLLASNQIPYDWWTGYHEAKGTGRPWSEGVVRSYTFHRIDAFCEWVCRHWQVDRARTFAGGTSMGGAGALVYASHRPDRIAWAVSWVGVHTPADSPQFTGSYEHCYGRVAWKLKHESGQAAFDYFDDAAWIRRRPEQSMPFMAFSNGKDDGGIGWPQAVRYFRALQQARQPHLFRWGLGGHGVRAMLPGPGATGNTLRLDIRTDQSLPAFTQCSLDGDPGTGTELAKPQEYPEKEGDGTVRVRKDRFDGDPYGWANRWLYWRTDDVVDEPARWAMTVALMKQAPADECTVSVTPRRLQKLRPRPGEAFTWTARPAADGSGIQRGPVTADKWGLITLPTVRVRKGGSRIELSRRTK
jgi:hypothetical protein